ncbi:MAG TPA: hybrid sensor histidine kinase/response regulator [Candidatus Acidoferrales bacterium]|nr:hybrid sensor histidine kinase/response regulator [Candidatus Acidoferrales bacterium]
MDERQKILAVDDAPDNLILLDKLLKRRGFDVVNASSGKECLSKSISEHPDLIILDVAMPEMSGFETLKHLRENEITKGIPVIILTANSKDAKSIEEGFTLGADEYLTKPIEQDELIARVRSILRAVKAEQDLEQLKADFQSMLVHDLRSPLSVIIGVLELAANGEFDKNPVDLKEFLGSALDTSQKMLTLINDILDVAKLEAGKLQLNKQPNDFNVVVGSAVARLKVLAREKEISLTIREEKNIPICEFDSGKLEQVVTNLVSNAIKFTPKDGTVNIRTYVKHFDDEVPGLKGDYAALDVEDTGVGISSDEIPLIFDRYRQVKSAQASKQKGTGLGLTIVKRVTEAHGGKVFVESSLGRGTRFSVVIPLSGEKK